MRPPYRKLRSTAPNPAVLGRRFCPRCGRWRQLCDFHVENCPAGVRFQSYCWGCYRAYRRVRWDTVHGRQHLDVTPIADALRVYHRGGSWRALARTSGVTERTIRRYVSGEIGLIRVVHADVIALALGTSLATLYPEAA